MPSISAFAGLDGGATKTTARVIDLEGEVIGEGAGGPGSLTLSPEAAADSCRQALQQALLGTGIELASCHVVCGLAGQRQPAKRAAFEEGLSELGALELISDGYAALLGAHQGAPGAIVVAGTGSVALSMDERGKIRQVGGFGPVVGDEAGGNWLGRNAVRATLKAMDDAALGEGRLSPLSSSLIERMGGDHEAMLAWIGAADATRFAALVPLILDHDACGDALAKRLLGEAVREVSRLIRLIGQQGRFPVSLIGGLAAMLTARLAPTVRAQLTSPRGDPMDGALLRARSLAPLEVID